MAKRSPVRVRVESLVIPTYLPAAPDKNPMFLEKRVYQGSNGKVYPLPFTDRIAEKPVDRKWKAVWIENEFLRAMVLPELGGRIHVLQDKTNGYDLIYNQRVIKPALVGLAGPWISGGIEFNWPQHHRPATFLPVDFKIEEHTDGSKTIWCSDHDPMTRMKGMHGVCLHPERAYLELKVRAYNRTPFVQTFLWWANVATRVHEAYQSFFPPDVYYIADHARRSMSEYPLARGFYYGVNYGERGRKGILQNEIPKQFVPPRAHSTLDVRRSMFDVPNYSPNDLSFYGNIPTPCIYMCMGSKEDFFGGYDHKAQAGIVHIANHHISPGKKQWTWGNHEFGYAWDRNLTDKDSDGEFGPYIEIMAGVYTDNQPDFSFLQPGETKTWSQFWYPIQKIGPAQHANLDAAISLRRSGVRQNAANIRIGISATRIFRRARITLVVNKVAKKNGGVLPNAAKQKVLANFTRDLAPGSPFVKEIKLPRGIAETDLLLRVSDADGTKIISHQPRPRAKGEVPPPATEPLPPEAIPSADELFITGLHLEQYRHATRCPTLYWREALRRDSFDSRCNNAMGLWHLKRGEFAEAETHFRKAIERLTRRNPNPCDGEAYYNLGLCLRFQYRDEEAYAAFYKVTWNQAWIAAGFHALAELDCKKSHWLTTLDHLNRSLRLNTDNLRARNLKVIVLRKLANVGQASRLSQNKIQKQEMETAATAVLQETMALDPLDWWARHLAGQKLECDLQTALDMARDFARTGLYVEAIELLSVVASPKRGGQFSLSPGESAGVRADNKNKLPDQEWGALPLVHYTLGWLHARSADPEINVPKAALASYKTAAALPPDYCFPARLEEIAILEAAMRANSRDAKAPYYLGNLLYDRRRHAEAIRLWENSARLEGNFSIAWRNLGIGYFNISKNSAKARAAYDKAFHANPNDARLLFERDQLWKRVGENPKKRLCELERFPQLVSQRDDLSVEFCALLNQTGRHVEAMQLLAKRKFQPWEGGEGAALGQHVRTQLALGREALARVGVQASACLDSTLKRELQLALTHFENALASPENLSEAKHLLANQSDIHYWLGSALDLLGEKESARKHWLAAATFKGDFQEMSARAFSEMTFYSALSWERLGQKAKAKKLLRDLLAYAEKLANKPAKIDYFATSLPTMLLFDDDLRSRQETSAQLLQAQAHFGLGRKMKAKSLLKKVLRRDPNHALATDLLSEFFN